MSAQWKRLSLATARRSRTRAAERDHRSCWCHGTLWGQASAWALVRAALEAKFTVYGMDRRGRGGSGPVTDHALEREIEDVAALVDSIDEPVHLPGHSLGALCALGATSLTSNIRSLILYEPPAAKYTSAKLLSVMDGLVKQGDQDTMIVMAMRDVIRVPQAQIDLLRTFPVWAEIVARAPTVVPEMRAIREYKFDVASFRRVQQPTLLLVGGASDPSIREVNEQLHQVLPRSQLVELAGQQHGATLTAPDLFVSAVCDFLASTG